MKITVNIAQKIGQPNYGSFGASCSFEMDVDQAMLDKDPQAVLSSCRLLGDLARAGVERELDLQRKGAAPAPPRQEPHADELRPGDPAFERQRPARQDNRPPDSRPPERRQADREDRQQAYRERFTEPEPDRPARYDDGRGQRDDRQSGRRGSGGARGEGAPTSARQFLGWLGKQDQDVKDRVKRVIKSWDLPPMMRDWTNDTAEDVYREITEKRESASHANGSANGHSNGYSNGRSY